MNKKLAIIILGLAASLASQLAYAADNPAITFPIPELGNCADKAACKTYCNQTEHMDECTAFAQAHNLISKKEALKAQKFQELLKTKAGPGGCSTPRTCNAYCSEQLHNSECVTFAKKIVTEPPTKTLAPSPKESTEMNELKDKEHEDSDKKPEATHVFPPRPQSYVPRQSLIGTIIRFLMGRSYPY